MINCEALNNYEIKPSQEGLIEILNIYNSISAKKYKVAEIMGCSDCRDTVINSVKKYYGYPVGRLLATRKTVQTRYGICRACPHCVDNTLFYSCGKFGKPTVEITTKTGKKQTKEIIETTLNKLPKYLEAGAKEITCGCLIKVKIQGNHFSCPQNKW